MYFAWDVIGKQLGSIFNVFRLGFDWEAIGKRLGSIFRVFSSRI